MNRMNYYISCCLCIALLFGFSSAAFAEPFRLEGKTGVFIPSSSKMRKIFHVAMPFVELEGSCRLCCSDWDTWAGVGCIFGRGESIGCGNTTTIEVIPFTLGVRRYFALCPCIDGFLGFGGLWSLYRNHDHTSSVHQHISSNAFGAVAKAGFQYRMNDCLSISFFGEYMYQRFDFSRVYPEHFTYRHDVNMSGIKIGLGVIYSF